MKSTDIIRKVDKLGRIVVPSDLRRALHIDNGDPLDVYEENGAIVLHKKETACIFTRETEDLYEYKGKKVSKKAIEELVKLLDAPKKG